MKGAMTLFQKLSEMDLKSAKSGSLPNTTAGAAAKTPSGHALLRKPLFEVTDYPAVV